jgi:hypothetical protein
MSSSQESNAGDSSPNDQGESAKSPRPRPIVLRPVTGPPVPDMTARIEDSLRRHEAELAKAERLVAQARAGTPPTYPERPTEPSPPPAPGDYRIEFDWRGETAHCVEHDRRVRIACFYWGGPKGSVSHVDGVWEYTDGRRERLSPEERTSVLQRVVDQARKRENIRLEIEGD